MSHLFYLALILLVNFTNTICAEQAGKIISPEEVVVGGEIKISWDGPTEKKDFISIDAVDAESDSDYGSPYGYPAKKNPFKLRAPTEPGTYLIRYHLGETGYAVIATTSIKVIDATATVEAPATAQIATEIKVKWSGPANRGDFISIDAIDSEDKEYGNLYGYPSKGNPLKLRVPDEPGEYEIRYHLERSYRVLGKTKLSITDVEAASIQVQPETEAGSEVTVIWTGPDGKGDFISIDPIDSEEKTYGKQYSYPKKGNPLKITVPQKPGKYEVRYHLARTYRVIATSPLTVIDINATLNAPASVAAGSKFKVDWTGPGYQGDYISVDALDAEEKEYGKNYGYTREQGETVAILAPDDAGEYQLRYHLNGSYNVLATAPLKVEPVSAGLTAPETVEVSEKFKVGWEGPGNPRDIISLLTLDAEEQKPGNNYSYTKRGNPVRIQAPKMPGAYELRYLTGQKFYTLATKAITVVPGTTPGTLRVTNDAASTDSKGSLGAVEMVLDASGSMLKKLNDKRRIELARRALINLTKDVLPENTLFALRVFGHKEAEKCRTDLEIPLAPLNKSATIAQIESIQAMNLAKTPIGDSLLKIKDDLADVEGPALVILVTDGEETCDGDPKAAIEQLQQAGFDVRVNIIGFAIDELGLKEEFETWAALGNGRYFDAQSANELTQAIQESLQIPFEVRQDEIIISTGVVNGAAIQLKPGEYQILLRTNPLKEIGSVTIEAEKESELAF